MNREKEVEAVKQLRKKTLAGYLDCRKAYRDAGDLDGAEKLIRKRGLAKAAKKKKRNAGVGVIRTYVHAGSRIASMVEVACETDFAARTEEFCSFAYDLSMHVAAMSPRWMTVEDIPLEYLAEGSGNEGDCLLSQPFVKDHSLSVQEVLSGLSAKLGEKCRIVRFQRWAAGEVKENNNVSDPDCEETLSRPSAVIRTLSLLILGLIIFASGFVLGSV